MKKLVVMMAVLTFAACGKDETKKPPVDANACTAAQNGNSRCTGTIWQTCNGGSWANTKDCGPTQQCQVVVGLPTAVQCYSPAVPGAEFETCTTALPCATGLVCSDIAALSDKVCLTACTGSECGADRYCETTWKTEGIASTNFCSATSAVGSFCWSTDSCVGVTDAQCYPVTGVSPECLQGCPVANLGTATGCSGGDLCLYGASWDYQGGDPASPIDCSTTACATGFDCLTFSIDNSGGTADYCVRRDGVCGTSVPVFTQNTSAQVEAWIATGSSLNIAHICDMPNAGNFCAPSPVTATAKTECESAGGWGATFSNEAGDNFPCTADVDCYLIGGQCMNFGSPTGQVCAASINLCAAFCENQEGTETYTCTGIGGGNCIQPTTLIGRPIVEGGTSAPVTCTTPDTQDVCSADYLCTQFSDGNYCARSRKICN
jgi:hypothetical protein